MTILTVGWTGAYSIGHMPQDAGYVDETPLTIGWTGKVSTYVLPYDLDDLTVRPGDPDPVVVNPPTGPAPPPPGPVAGGPTPTPPSGTVRPPAAPRVSVQSRVNPVNFRARGIRIRIVLPERARVDVYATARVRKRLSRRRTTTVKRRITQRRSLTLPKGTSVLRILPTALGRRTVGPRSRLTATVTIRARYRDGRLVTVNRSVAIARSAKKS